MTERERQLHCIRYLEIEAEPTALAEGRVVRDLLKKHRGTLGH